MRLIAAFALSVAAIGVLAAAFPAEPFWDALAFGFARYESGGGSLAGTRHTRAGAFLAQHSSVLSMTDAQLIVGEFFRLHASVPAVVPLGGSGDVPDSQVPKAQAAQLDSLA